MAAAASTSLLPAFLTKVGRNLHPFLFVGCWNLRGAARDAVVTAMTTRAAEEGIQNIVLGGDNVYPTHEQDEALNRWKETKEGPKPPKHTPDVFLEGIGMFEPYFVTLALGNHNVNDTNVFEVEMGYLPVRNRYYIQEFEDAVLVVFDSNITKGASGYEAMKAWLESALIYIKMHGKPYYFVTHEPFGSFKKGKTTIWGISKGTMTNAAKENSDGDRARVTIESGSTPDVLSVLQTHPPVSVLCADTHHYEDGVITGGTEPIRQIIVGSGGASYNAYSKSLMPFSLGKSFVYSMTSAPIEMYGFLSIREVGHFEFLPVLDWSAVGGARRTRRRRRRSYKKMTRRHARR